MVFWCSCQNWKIGTQICVFVTSILLIAVPLSCIPMVYLGDNMLNKFTEVSYLTAQKTFLKETNLIGSAQKQVVFEFQAIGNQKLISLGKQTLTLMNKLLIRTNHTVSQSQALLMSTYITDQNSSMAVKYFPGATIDIYSPQFINQAFQISTIIPLIWFDQGITQSIQFVLPSNFLVIYPAHAMPQDYKLSEQIWFYQFMHGFQQLAQASIDVKLEYNTIGMEAFQIGMKAFCTVIPCFNKQGDLIGSLMYETKTSVIKELVSIYRNTEYTQYIVQYTGLLIFTEVNNSNYSYFQNSSITGFDQWDWVDIITNNYKNNTCKNSPTIKLVCKHNSLYNKDSYLQATFLPTEQLFIISVITEEYLQQKIGQETNFVSQQFNSIQFNYVQISN